ncbi:MAG: glycosyltransferase family 1 protein [Candidatus Omnitrophota bacterium]|nr:glycosyltransferase family 1 protein [Candidatus Omnitrophota bacterium]
MKIAINATSLNGLERSGLFVYTDNLLNNLAAADPKNEYFILFNSLRRKSHQMPGSNKSNFKKVVLPVPDMKFPLRNFILNNCFLPNFFKKNNCDIYHAPAGFSLPSANRIKKILTVHDLRTLKIADNDYPQDISSLRKALKSADVCITVSEATKKDILDNFNVLPNKIKVVYEGAEERFKPINDQNKLDYIRNKYGLNKKYFFSVGAAPRKNVERLIRAFKLFKFNNDFLLAIGGEGSSGPWAAKHKSLIRDLGLENKVIMLGYIPDDDLPMLYNASECFVFPSLYEGFGIPLLEAMNCGVPIIASNVSSLPEIGGDAALYVDPYDETSIAKAMKKIAEDEQLKKQLIEKGFKRAKEFSWQKMAREILQIYNELI